MKCKNKMKSFIWFTISILPIVVYLICLCNRVIVSGSTVFTAVTFESVLSDFGVNNSNIVVSTFNNAFIAMGFGEITWISGYLAYWIIVKLCHICFDVLVFLIDVVHKAINKLEGENDEDFI